MPMKDGEGEKTMWSRSERTREKKACSRSDARDFFSHLPEKVKRREGTQERRKLAHHQLSSSLNNSAAGLDNKQEGVWSDDRNAQLDATTQFWKFLSIERSPPINEVIQSGVVPRFIEFLSRDDIPQLQFEAAWAMTNIASGTSEDTRVVIDHGAVPIFVRLLSSPTNDVREQAVWHWEMLPVTHLNAVILSLAMGR